MGRYTRHIPTRTAFLFIMLTTLVACSSISVTSDWDPGVDFSQFKTFAVLEEMPPPINRLTAQRIRAAIVAELTAKGLRQADTPDEADLAIGYQVTTEQQTSYHTVHSGLQPHGYRRSRVHWGSSVGTSRTTQVNFTVGTLVIAAFQMSDKELVWEGSASGTVNNPSSGPEQREQRIRDAVQRILEDFPPDMTSGS